MNQVKAWAVVHRAMNGFIGSGTGKHSIFWTRNDAVAEQARLNKFHKGNKFKVAACYVSFKSADPDLGKHNP